MRPDAGLKMMSVMVMIISYYRQGFRYSAGAEDLKSCIFDVCCQQCISMGDQLNIAKKKHASMHYCQCRSASGSTPCFSVSEACNSLFMFFGGSVMRFVEESPLGLVKHCMAARAMERFYMSVRPRKHESGIDLNRSTIKYEDESFFSTRRAMSIVPTVKTPWELGVNAVLHLDDMECAEAILEKIGEGSNEKRKCIVHYEPKYIEVCLASIKLCLNGACEMESDIFDAALGRFKQIDDEAYFVGKYGRWRHFFESDFLGSIIAGCFDINDPSIRAQVLGDHLEYDIANCRMLYFPGIVEQRWVCYAWCLQLNSIMVFDPCALKCPPNGVVMVHKQVAASIEAVMEEVGSKISARLWDHDWKAASVTMLKMAVGPDQWVNRSGLMCAQFCFSFNGSADDTANHIDTSREAFAILMGEISKLACNHGCIHEVLG